MHNITSASALGIVSILALSPVCVKLLHKPCDSKHGADLIARIKLAGLKNSAAATNLIGVDVHPLSLLSPASGLSAVCVARVMPFRKVTTMVVEIAFGKCCGCHVRVLLHSGTV